jgi:hypothetical protein
VARDDPLDTYLVHHPEAIFGAPVEATVLDPANRYVLAPQLACAAAEAPLTPADLVLFGDGAKEAVDELVAAGALRQRPTGWYWRHRERPEVDLRGEGGAPVCVVEAATGRLLGTVDGGSSHFLLHPGAVYLHQGVSYVVDELDLADGCALVHVEEPDWSTHARDVTDLSVVSVRSYVDAGPVGMFLGEVDVTSQVVSYQRRRIATGELIDTRPLDLPARELRTAAADRHRRGDRHPTARPARPGTAHGGGLVHPVTAVVGSRRSPVGRRAGCVARRRTRRDRPATADGDLRPVGHRRALHRRTRGHRGTDRLRVRRAPGWRRVRRAGVRDGVGMAAGDPGRDRGVRLRDRLPVLRPVAEVRKRQQSALQTGRDPGARRGVGEPARVAGCMNRLGTGHNGMGALPSMSMLLIAPRARGEAVADTIAETVDLLYNIDQDHLTLDQQIALGSALAALAQAERLELINERLRVIHQVLNTWAVRAATSPDGR